jgi:uncharacterized cupredoxin-like copper-binding protein
MMMDVTASAAGGRLRRAASLMMAAAALLALPACGGDDAAEDTQPVVRVDEARDTLGPGDAAMRADTGVAATTGGEIQARMTEWAIELSDDTVRTGQVTFRVHNAGEVHHALEVEGEGIEEEMDHLPSGGTATLTVNLTPGTYEVYCPVVSAGVSHREQGMTTTLIVQD